MHSDSPNAGNAATNRSDIIREMARKYIWWKSADDASLSPRRVVAQIMNIGDFYDVRFVWASLGSQVFRDVLEHAEAGWFNGRSWAYWHYRCGLIPFGENPPPLPTRHIRS